MKLKKGSAEAKAYMAKIRGMKKGSHGKIYKALILHKSSVRPMAKRRRARRFFSRRRRGVRDRRLPLLPLIPAAYRFAIEPIMGNSSRGIGGAMNHPNPAQEFVDVITINAFGKKLSDNSDWGGLMGAVTNTWVPIIMGYVGSRVASAIGVNRAMKRIPVVGKYIKL